MKNLRQSNFFKLSNLLLGAFIALSFIPSNAQTVPRRGINFSGNDFLNLNTVTSRLVGNNTFTVEFTMRADITRQTATGGGNWMLYAINDASTAGGNLLLISLSNTTNALGTIFIQEVSGGTTTNIIGQIVVGDNECHHIAYVKNMTTTELYVDGVLDPGPTPIVSPLLPIANGDPMSIGQEWDAGGTTTSQFYTGDMDEFRIWTDVRTVQEIRDNMQSSVNPNSPNLLVYYNFDQGIAGGNNTAMPNIADQTINGLNGVFANRPGFTWALNGLTSNIVIDSCSICEIVDESNNSVTVIADQTVINSNTVWGGTQGDKYYIDGLLTVTDRAILDLTNLDLVFSQTGRIVVEDGAIIRANNSVFRPCNILDTWEGIEITSNGDFANATGMFNECTFKNAFVAIEVSSVNSTMDVSVTNNLFKNCYVGVHIDKNMQVYQGNLTGNTFEVDRYLVEYVNSIYTGILLEETNADEPISQNNFVNLNRGSAAIQLQGVQMILNSDATVSDNHFSGCENAMIIIGSGGNLENNKIEVTSSATNTVASAQILVSFCNNLLNIAHNEITFNEYGTDNFVRGIEVQNSEAVNVYSNKISEFGIGISINESISCSAYENEIFNASFQGFNLQNVDNVDISCNLIDNQYTGTPVGIYYLNSGTVSNRIYSNCIFDCMRSMQLDGSGPIPDIKNNYLYNYTLHGIMVQGLTGAIGTGITPATAGRNSFFSNNLNNGAFDVFSIIPGLLLNGNYNPVNIGPGANVTGTNANQFNSTASCGHQEDNTNGQYLFDEPCEAEPQMEGIFVNTSGGITFSQNYKERLHDLKIHSNEFVPVLVYANYENKLDDELVQQLLPKLDTSKLPEFNFLLGILEHNNDLSKKALSNMGSGIPRSHKFVYQGQFEKQFTNGIRSSSIGSIQNEMEVNTKDYNLMAAFLQSAISNHNQSYRVKEIKESKVIPTHVALKAPLKGNFKVYPNPANDRLNVFFSLSQVDAGSKIVITSVDGKVVLEKSIEDQFDQIELDINGLESGMYYIRIGSGDDLDNAIKAQKFIKL